MAPISKSDDQNQSSPPAVDNMITKKFLCVIKQREEHVDDDEEGKIILSLSPRYKEVLTHAHAKPLNSPREEDEEEKNFFQERKEKEKAWSLCGSEVFNVVYRPFTLSFRLKNRLNSHINLHLIRVHFTEFMH